MGGVSAHGQDPGAEGPSASPTPFFGGEAPPPDDDLPQAISREEWLAAVHGDIDPAKYAGEGYGATEEYFPQDIDSPWVRGDVVDEGAYYPGPEMRRRKWPPYRGF